MSKRLTECDEFGNADIIGVDSADLQLNLEFDALNAVTDEYDIVFTGNVLYETKSNEDTEWFTKEEIESDLSQLPVAEAALAEKGEKNEN
jgi:hypothetical protein